MKYVITILFLFSSLFMFSQEKKEHEKHINRSDFPENALAQLNTTLDKAKRIRYLKETDGDHHSYEAKFKLYGRWFSVEFNEEGELEDVEIDIRKRDIPNENRKKIESYFDSHFERWKMEKIQQQYTQIDVLLSEPNRKAKIALEIILATKVNGKLTKFELLFDAQGDFVSKRKILRESYDFHLF